jgi:hypothetical protein
MEITNRIDDISNRIKIVATELGVDVEDIASLKLIFLMPDNIKTKFGYFTHAFQSVSEFEAGIMCVNSRNANKIMRQKLFPTIRFPIGERDKVIQKINQKNVKDIFWIQHETGLELIGTFLDILLIRTSIIDIYNLIRIQIIKNITNDYSDRTHKSVTKILIVYRHCKKNKLIEKNINESEIKEDIQLLEDFF